MKALIHSRTKYLLIFVLLLSLSLSLIACAQKVKVRTGSRVVCKYGEVLKDNTKVISVPKSKASKYKVKVTKTLCSKHKTLEKYYNEALAALSKGDFTGAQKLFKKIAESDPDFKDVQAQIERVNVAIATGTLPELSPGTQPGSEQPGAQPGTPGATQPGSPTSPDDETSPPGGDETPRSGPLLDLIPTRINGYSLYSEGSTALSASRIFRPRSSTKVNLLTIAVENLGTREAAKEWIDKNIKRSYSSDGRTLRIEGQSCYFGTDGRSFAILTWYDRNIVYQVEMYTKGSPKDVRNEIIEVGKKVIT